MSRRLLRKGDRVRVVQPTPYKAENMGGVTLGMIGMVTEDQTPAHFFLPVRFDGRSDVAHMAPYEIEHIGVLAQLAMEHEEGSITTVVKGDGG